MSITLIQSTKSSVRNILPRLYSSKSNENEKPSKKFETVFSFPTAKYIALINRLKVYHLIGTSIAIPSTAVMEIMNIMPNSLFPTAYVGLTGAAVLSLTTLPFRNIIGHLYISEDNEKIKISSVDFWGRRIDKIVAVEDWIPLLEMKPKTMDALYLSPQLTDGTTYILPIKFGKVLNAQKMGQVLE